MTDGTITFVHSQAALIMQVLQLSDEQIALLPPDQRQSIMILKDQIARSQPHQWRWYLFGEHWHPQRKEFLEEYIGGIHSWILCVSVSSVTQVQQLWWTWTLKVGAKARKANIKKYVAAMGKTEWNNDYLILSSTLSGLPRSSRTQLPSWKGTCFGESQRPRFFPKSSREFYRDSLGYRASHQVGSRGTEGSLPLCICFIF